MNLLKSYDNNKEKHSINAVSVVGTGATDTFTGRAGQGIDTLFAGPYHPDFGKLKELLQLQLDRRLDLSKWNIEITPGLEQIFIYLDVDYHYDKPPSDEDIKKMQKFINDSERKMKYVDIDIKYDKEKHVDKTHFINTTSDWKIIYKDKIKSGDKK